MTKPIEAYMVVDKSGKPVYGISQSIYTSKRTAKSYILPKLGESVVKVKIMVAKS